MNPLLRSSSVLLPSLLARSSPISLAPLASLPPPPSLSRSPLSPSPTLLSSRTQIRTFFNKQKAEDNLFDYFGPNRPSFFPPPSSPLDGKNNVHIEEIKKNKKPSFVELARQLKGTSYALKDMLVWRALFFKHSMQQPEGTLLTRREAGLSRLISQEFRTSAPYLVLFMLPFLGNFLLPAYLLWTANTSPASLPRLFWTDRIRLRTRRDLWKRKKYTRQTVRSFLVDFVEENHDSLKTLDIFDIDKIKMGLQDLEASDHPCSKWVEGVSALIPLLESEQFLKCEFPAEYKQNLFFSCNPTPRTYGYSTTNFDSYGHYLMGVDSIIEKDGVDNLPNKDVVWLCEERGFWGADPCQGKEIIENLPFPDDKARVAEMREVLKSWLKTTRNFRNSSPDLLTYYHLLALYGGPFSKSD